MQDRENSPKWWGGVGGAEALYQDRERGAGEGGGRKERKRESEREFITSSSDFLDAIEIM